MNDNEREVQVKTINLKEVLKNVGGEEYTDKSELGSVLLFALGQKKQNQSTDITDACHSLRNRIFKSEEIELTNEEIKILKDQVNYSTLSQDNYFAIVDLLEG